MPFRRSGDVKFYEAVARQTQKRYDLLAKDYRKSDSLVDDPAHTDLGQALTRLCTALDRPLTVLDLGCGCGRYFRFLQGAERIVGVDVSSQMLKEAEHPAGEELIKAQVELICGNFLTMDFQEQRFDLIYSCGVLGECVPLDNYLIKRLYRWLKPDGIAFLVVVDARSPQNRSWKGNMALSLRRFMPSAVQRWIDARPNWPYLRLYETELRRLMAEGSFECDVWGRGVAEWRLDLVCEARKVLR